MKFKKVFFEDTLVHTLISEGRGCHMRANSPDLILALTFISQTYSVRRVEMGESRSVYVTLAFAGVALMVGGIVVDTFDHLAQL